MRTRNTIICDLDGTLCDITHRLHHIKNVQGGQRPDWYAFSKDCIHDIPKPDIIRMINAHFDTGFNIKIVSGRSDVVAEETLDWLSMHGVRYHDIMMRPHGNNKPDQDLKRDWLLEGKLRCDIADVYFVVEDRKRMVEMWRSLGLVCMQVAEGDF